MHTSRTFPALSVSELHDLHDQAKATARTLRQSAIDEFWRTSFTVLRASLAAALRLPKPQAQRAGPQTQKAAALASPCLGCGAA